MQGLFYFGKWKTDNNNPEVLRQWSEEKVCSNQ
jgi:hypothetical protein